MKIRASDLAKTLLLRIRNGKEPSEEAITNLAILISRGNGASRKPNRLRGYMVLRHPLRHGRYPSVVQLRMPSVTPDSSTLFSTAHLITATSTASADPEKPPGWTQYWAPIPSNIKLRGPIKKVVAATKDHPFHWFDLASVPFGGVIFMIDPGGFFHGYQLFAPHWWLSIKLNPPRLVDVVLPGDLEGVTRIKPVKSKRQLFIWQPHW